MVSGCCAGADGRGKGDEGKRLKVVFVAKTCCRVVLAEVLEQCGNWILVLRARERL